MKLSKKICKRCVIVNGEDWNAIDDEDRWRRGWVTCPAKKHHSFSLPVVSPTVDLPRAPDKCPYALEHVISEGEER